MITSMIRGERPTSEEQRRKHRLGIARSLVILLGLIILTVWIALQREGPEVISLTMARALDSEFQPVEPTGVFTPEDTFFMSAEVRGYEPRMDVVARWRYEGRIITETPLITTDTGDGFIAFSLSPEDPPEWPVGEYVVDVMFEGDLLARTAFEVVEEQE